MEKDKMDKERGQTQEFLNEQVRAAQNKITYTCQGPLRTPEEMKEAQDEVVASARRAALNHAVFEAEKKGDKFDEESFEFDEEVPSVPYRKGCGEDLTEVIEALPVDDREHVYKCPRCGNKGTARRTSAQQLKSEAEDLEKGDGANL